MPIQSVLLMVFFLWRYIRVHQREFSDRHSLFGMNMVVGIGTVLLSFGLLLLGGATGLIGDPSGRTDERSLNQGDVVLRAADLRQRLDGDVRGPRIGQRRRHHPLDRPQLRQRP